MAVDDHGGVAGHAILIPATRSRIGSDDRTLGHLGQLFVRRAHWGTGLAKQLLELAIADATERDFTAMRLFTPAAHARARHFYEREGWSAQGEPMLEQPLGLELIEYRRPLNPRPPS